MKITQISTTLHGTPEAATKHWPILTAVGAPPLRTFQQVLYLRFATAGAPDGLQLDASQTQWQVHFQPITYNALEPPVSALAADVRNTGQNTVVVELDAPRQLKQVRLLQSLALGGGAALEVYRLDGNQVAEKPTVTAPLGASNPNFELAGIAFQSRSMGAQSAPSPGAAAGNGLGQGAGFRQASVGNTANLAADFTDARFAVRLKDPSQSPANLQANQIASLSLRSYPTGPRLGLADPAQLAAGDPNAVLFFDRLDGEIGKGDEPQPGAITADQTFATALQRHLDERFAALTADLPPGSAPLIPAAIDVALVMASDAPCQVQINTFAVSYHLVRHSFPDRSAKQVLRFGAAQVETQTVALTLPTQAKVTSALLSVTTNVGAARPVAMTDAPALDAASLTQAIGIRLHPERWAAQPLTPAQAIQVSGLMLGLVGLTRDTHGLLTIHEDLAGRPGGKIVAEAPFSLPAVGQRQWQRLLLPAPVIMPAQPHWLLLKILQGAAVWLAEEHTPAALIVAATPNGTVGEPLYALPQTHALHRLLSTGASDSSGQTASPLTLTVGTATITGQPEAGDKVLFDFTSALATAPANGLLAATKTINLALTSSAAGTITVYPPRLLYDH